MIIMTDFEKTIQMLKWESKMLGDEIAAMDQQNSDIEAQIHTAEVREDSASRPFRFEESDIKVTTSSDRKGSAVSGSSHYHHEPYICKDSDFQWPVIVSEDADYDYRVADDDDFDYEVDDDADFDY